MPYGGVLDPKNRGKGLVVPKTTIYCREQRGDKLLQVKIFPMT